MDLFLFYAFFTLTNILNVIVLPLYSITVTVILANPFFFTAILPNTSTSTTLEFILCSRIIAS